MEERTRKFSKRGTALTALTALVMLAAAGIVWRVGYLPVYGAERRFWGVLLMAGGVACLIAMIAIWYAGYDRLRETLKREYGERCCAPAPVKPDAEAQGDEEADS